MTLQPHRVVHVGTGLTGREALRAIISDPSRSPRSRWCIRLRRRTSGGRPSPTPPRQGQSTCYATGSEPGYVSLNLPTALLTGAGTVDSLRMDEYALDLDESYPIWAVLHESMGFGKVDDALTLFAPSTYVILRDDRAVGEAWARRNARRIGADLVELDGGHSPFFARPVELTGALLTVES